MAESAVEKLKRIAKEKKDARLAAESAATVSPDSNEYDGGNPVTGEILQTEQGISKPEPDGGGLSQVHSEPATGIPDGNSGIETATESVQESGSVYEPGISDNGVHLSSGSNSNHPLAMQFAELEQALLARDPQFKTILRQVHKHLGQDPELVTQMTEDEIATIVGGLVLFANTEVVEPAKAKAVKAQVAAAKKKVISADDL